VITKIYRAYVYVARVKTAVYAGISTRRFTHVSEICGAVCSFDLWRLTSHKTRRSRRNSIVTCGLFSSNIPMFAYSDNYTFPSFNNSLTFHMSQLSPAALNVDSGLGANILPEDITFIL